MISLDSNSREELQKLRNISRERDKFVKLSVVLMLDMGYNSSQIESCLGIGSFDVFRLAQLYLTSPLSEYLKEYSKEGHSTSLVNEVIIGDQIWMTENLNVDRFRNGTVIPHAKSNEDWLSAGLNARAAWCYYDNNPTNGDKYGKLYNWYAVISPNGLAPERWHIPSIDEWNTLVEYLGNSPGKKMKHIRGWGSIGNGTNESGFSGMAGGQRYTSGDFGGATYGGYWWSTSMKKDDYDAIDIVSLISNLELVIPYDVATDIRYFQKRHGILYNVPVNISYGFSVRCLKY